MEQISQVLQRNQLILPTQADQPDETESLEIGQKKKHLQLQHHSDEQLNKNNNGEKFFER